MRMNYHYGACSLLWMERLQDLVASQDPVNFYKTEIKPIQTFDPIEVPPVVIDKIDLSTNQKYLLKIYEAVSSGRVSEDLGKRSAGSLNHARWFTTTNRILRICLHRSPRKNLITLVNFVMRVYIPMWFEIKANPYVVSGFQSNLIGETTI